MFRNAYEEYEMNLPTEINLAGTDHEVARWIWKNLVPKSGQASFVQAEILRAIEKLRWEAQSNGNINWDDRFTLLTHFIEKHLGSQPCFNDTTKEVISNDINRLRKFKSVPEIEDVSDLAANGPYTDDDLYNRLTDRLIDYCRSHPKLIPHNIVPEQYR